MTAFDRVGTIAGVTDDQTGSGGLSRRLVLLGGLAVALGVSACGRTSVTGQDAPSSDPDTPGSPTGGTATVSDLTGDYAIADPTTGTQVEVTVASGTRTIRANGLPNHATGQFPNPGNPNRIAPQAYVFQLPQYGTRADRLTALVLPQPFGIAINGVLFDPLAAEWYRGDPTSGWTLEALGPGADLGLDTNNAHVQPSGAYHYHGLPAGLLSRLDGSTHAPLLGWAGDGFPIYAPYGYRDPLDPASGVVELRSSYRLRTGQRPSGPGGTYDGSYTEDFEFADGYGDLDEANGRYGVTPDYPEGTYYYVLTSAFPFVPRYVVGPIAPSFITSGPGGPPGNNPGPPGNNPGPPGPPR
jgi:hypothetical protein